MMWRIVTAEGKDVFEEGRTYTKETAERIWDDYNGIAEDLDGNEIRIYIEEA